MDQEITALRRALEGAPDDAVLRARLIQARSRARDPKLLADFEALALILEALAAIAAAHGAFLEEPAEGVEGLVFLLDKFERLHRHWSGHPQEIWDSGRVALEAYLGERSLRVDRQTLRIGSSQQADIQVSIWEDIQSFFADRLFAAWEMPGSGISPVELVQRFFGEVGFFLGRCYQTGRQTLALQLHPIPGGTGLIDPRPVVALGIEAFDAIIGFTDQGYRAVLLSALESFDAAENRVASDCRLCPVYQGRVSRWSLNPNPAGPFTPVLRHLFGSIARGDWQRWSLPLAQVWPRSTIELSLMQLGKRWFFLNAHYEDGPVGYLEGSTEI